MGWGISAAFKTERQLSNFTAAATCKGPRKLQNSRKKPQKHERAQLYLFLKKKKKGWFSKAASQFAHRFLWAWGWPDCV